MASRKHQRRILAVKVVLASTLTRSCVSFAPPSPFVANRVGGIAAIFCVKGCRPRGCWSPGSITSPLRAADSDLDDGGAHGNESFEHLVGIEEFRAEKSKRDPGQATGAASGVGKGVGLGLEGAIFPSEAFPGSPGSDDITLQNIPLEDGQPQEMVGFWKLYGSTANGEDLSGRVILRADGQVVGGPTVRFTPGVKWSDPAGLQPVGGKWSVYSSKRTGRARLRFTIVLSFQKEQQLELDGVVLMVDGSMGEMAEHTMEAEERAPKSASGCGEPKPQVFGGVRKRSGEATDPDEGDFSMMKIQAGEDKLVASVGSQQRRFW